jgi:caffeoyl-CoA O-methyltransferase
MDINGASDTLINYAELYTTPESEVLAALNRETQASVRGAQMLSGHLQGALLSMLSYILKPTQILELGTYTGYSAICLAKGLQPGGLLHTIDIDDTLRDIRERHWIEAKLENCIKQHIGEAAHVIPNIDGQFDLVFIDADKKNYNLYFDLVIDRMATGGLIVVDNVLFHGEVIWPENQMGKTATVIHAFNQKIAADPRVEQVILPIRDGITLIRKK